MTERRVLNLGAGTQSSVLYLMMCRGELPAAEVALFADTQWEPRPVYEHLKWLECEGAGRVPIVRVTAGSLRNAAVAVVRKRKGDPGHFASIPLFVLNPDGSRGMIRRQCTKEYKILPIRKWIREKLLGLSARKPVPAGVRVVQVFGISFDERQRMRAADVRWSVHDYPLVDMKMRRMSVIDWAERHYPGRRFPRSACVACPYRSNNELREMKQSDPAAFADAIRFDEEIRAAAAADRDKPGAITGVPYVHRSCIPLADVNIDGDGPGLWDGVADNECEGMCGN